MICVTSLLMLFNLWVHKPVGLPCQIISRDGTLRLDHGFVTNAYLVNDNDSFLLSAGGRHPHGPVVMSLLNGLPSGSHLHVEFCDSMTVRLVSNGYEVFKLTQKRAEENVSRGMGTFGTVAMISFFAAILGWLLGRQASSAGS